MVMVHFFFQYLHVCNTPMAFSCPTGLPMSDQYVKLEEERRQKERAEKKKKEKKKRKEKRSGRGKKHDSGPESEEDITPAHMVDIVTEEMPEVRCVNTIIHF